MLLSETAICPILTRSRQVREPFETALAPLELGASIPRETGLAWLNPQPEGAPMVIESMKTDDAKRESAEDIS